MKNFEQWLEATHPEYLEEGWKDWAKKGVIAATMGAAGLGMMPGQAQARDPMNSSPHSITAKAPHDDSLLQNYVKEKRDLAHQVRAEKYTQDHGRSVSPHGIKIGDPKLREKFQMGPMTEAEWLKYAKYYGQPDKFGMVPNPSEYRSWIPGEGYDGVHVRASTEVENDVLTHKDIKVTPHKIGQPIAPVNWQKIAAEMEAKQKNKIHQNDSKGNYEEF